jgi:hypothetical protein
MKTANLSHWILCTVLTAGGAQADAVDELLAEYRGQGAGPFSAAAGDALWEREFTAADGSTRACTRCHTPDPRQPGRHAITGKAIEPLAPSANTKRLTGRRQVEKWLKRNCKWTLGRTCSPQEKGDLLTFLRDQ